MANNHFGVDAAGNVGIGISEPSQKLDVLGFARATQGFISNSDSALIFGSLPDQKESLASVFGAAGANGHLALAANGKEAMRIDGAGNVAIGTEDPKSKLHVVGIPAFANNAAAIAGGLTPGAFYRTGGDPDVLCVVH